MIYFELFYVFFYIGLFTFGGGYAMIPLITEETINRGWISSSTLSNFIAISESTPGPFAINIATFIGSQTGGILGSVCATIGVVLPSFIIILIIAAILTKFMKRKGVKTVLGTVSPIVLSLILSTAILFVIKMALYQGHNISSVEVKFDRESIALLLILAGLCIIYKKKKKKSLHPIAILGISALAGIILFGLFSF